MSPFRYDKKIKQSDDAFSNLGLFDKLLLAILTKAQIVVEKIISMPSSRKANSGTFICSQHKNTQSPNSIWLDLHLQAQ